MYSNSTAILFLLLHFFVTRKTEYFLHFDRHHLNVYFFRLEHSKAILNMGFQTNSFHLFWGKNPHLCCKILQWLTVEKCLSFMRLSLYMNLDQLMHWFFIKFPFYLLRKVTNLKNLKSEMVTFCIGTELSIEIPGIWA